MVSSYCYCWFIEYNGRDSFGGGCGVVTVVVGTVVWVGVANVLVIVWQWLW